LNIVAIVIVRYRWSGQSYYRISNDNGGRGRNSVRVVTVAVGLLVVTAAAVSSVLILLRFLFLHPVPVQRIRYHHGVESTGVVMGVRSRVVIAVQVVVAGVPMIHVHLLLTAPPIVDAGIRDTFSAAQAVNRVRQRVGVRVGRRFVHT